MILWLCPEVLEDTLFPESFHQVPVLHDAMTNWILCCIPWDISLITNVEVYDIGMRLISTHTHTSFNMVYDILLPRSSTPLVNLLCVLSPTWADSLIPIATKKWEEGEDQSCGVYMRIPQSHSANKPASLKGVAQTKI